MAGLAHCLAPDDLSVEIDPKSDGDLCRVSICPDSHQSQTLLIPEITDRATDVDVTSGQLAAMADQAGLATAQITYSYSQWALSTYLKRK